MRNKIILLVIVAMLGFTVSCTPAINTADDSKLAEVTCKFLTSEQSGGRLTGTAGNKAVESFITEKFEAIKLEAYAEGSYQIPYIHNYIDFDKSKITMELLLGDGSKIQCKYGIDFLLQNNLNNLNLNVPVMKAENVDRAKEHVLIIGQNEQYPDRNENLKGIIIKHKLFSRNISETEAGIPIVQVSEELYNKIVNNKDVIVKLQSDLKKEQVKANNIVGVIKGKKHDNALVISAHFDHVGQIGNQIFSGAMDNATGTAVLVDLADLLMKNNAAKDLEYDIVFCAFNGEESNLQGSKAFINDLSSRYKKLININLDCLGKKKSEGVLITGAGEISKELMNSLNEFLSSKKYKVDIDKEALYVSDHITFSDIGQLSVNISSLEAFQKDSTSGNSILHTAKDTYESIDIESLNRISKDLYEYIVSSAGRLFLSEPSHEGEGAINSQEDERIQAALGEEQKKLAFNQYKLVKLEDKSYIVQNNVGIFKDIKDLEKLFPISKFENKLNGYIFKDVMLILDIKKLNSKDMENDKVYEGEKVCIDNIASVELRYFDSKDQKDNIAIQIIKEKDNSQESIDFGTDTITKEYNIDGMKYNVIFLKQTNQIFAVETHMNLGDKYLRVIIRKYYIQKDGKGFKPNWTISSDEEITKFIKELGIPRYVNNIFAE